MSRRSSIGSDARLLHLDCFSGIAGNMFIGALLDAGLSRKELEKDLSGLGLPHRLVVKRVQRGALAARYVSRNVGYEIGPREEAGLARYAEILRDAGTLTAREAGHA